MKIHYSIPTKVPYGYIDTAIATWKECDLIAWEERCCDGRMMLIKNKSFLTDDMDKVTCKRCLKKWSKFVKSY